MVLDVVRRNILRGMLENPKPREHEGIEPRKLIVVAGEILEPVLLMVRRNRLDRLSGIGRQRWQAERDTSVHRFNQRMTHLDPQGGRRDILGAKISLQGEFESLSGNVIGDMRVGAGYLVLGAESLRGPQIIVRVAPKRQCCGGSPP